MIEELESHFRVCSGHVKRFYFRRVGEVFPRTHTPEGIIPIYEFEADELVAFECDVCGKIPEE